MKILIDNGHGEGCVNGSPDGKDFDFKKAWRCIVEATIFFLIVTCIYLVGKLKDQGEAAVQCVSSVSYVVTYTSIPPIS